MMWFISGLGDGVSVFLSNKLTGKPDCRDAVGHAHHCCQAVRIGMTYAMAINKKKVDRFSINKF